MIPPFDPVAALPPFVPLPDTEFDTDPPVATFPPVEAEVSTLFDTDAVLTFTTVVVFDGADHQNAEAGLAESMKAATITAERIFFIFNFLISIVIKFFFFRPLRVYGIKSIDLCGYIRASRQDKRLVLAHIYICQTARKNASKKLPGDL